MFGEGYPYDGFNLDIDGTSKIVFEDLTIDAWVMDPDYSDLKSIIEGYLSAGYSVAYDGVKNAVVALVASGTDVTVEVVYTKKNDTHTVSFSAAESVGCTLKNADGEEVTDTTKCQVSDQLYAVADQAAHGQKFSHWVRIQDNKQTIVGYETTYAFRMPDENMTLSAVYVAEAEEVEKVETGYIESVKRPAENKLSFVSILCVPDDCQMTKAGVVVQRTDILNGEELTTTNAKLTRYSDTSNNHYSSFKYTWTMSTSYPERQWTVRPYLEYTDKNGDTKTIYGEAVSKCVKDVDYTND